MKNQNLTRIWISTGYPQSFFLEATFLKIRKSTDFHNSFQRVTKIPKKLLLSRVLTQYGATYFR